MGLHGFFSTFQLACSNLRQENEKFGDAAPKYYLLRLCVDGWECLIVPDLNLLKLYHFT